MDREIIEKKLRTMDRFSLTEALLGMLYVEHTEERNEFHEYEKEHCEEWDAAEDRAADEEQARLDGYSEALADVLNVISGVAGGETETFRRLLEKQIDKVTK